MTPTTHLDNRFDIFCQHSHIFRKNCPRKTVCFITWIISYCLNLDTLVANVHLAHRTYSGHKSKNCTCTRIQNHMLFQRLWSMRKSDLGHIWTKIKGHDGLQSHWGDQRTRPGGRARCLAVCKENKAVDVQPEGTDFSQEMEQFEVLGELYFTFLMDPRTSYQTTQTPGNSSLGFFPLFVCGGKMRQCAFCSWDGSQQVLSSGAKQQEPMVCPRRETNPHRDFESESRETGAFLLQEEQTQHWECLWLSAYLANTTHLTQRKQETSHNNALCVLYSLFFITICNTINSFNFTGSTR